MISGNGWGLSFPDICRTVEEKPRKNLNKENLPDRGSNLGPLGERQGCYSLTTAVVDKHSHRKGTCITCHSFTQLSVIQLFAVSCCTLVVGTASAGDRLEAQIGHLGCYFETKSTARHSQAIMTEIDS